MTRDERTAPWAIWAYQCLYGIVWDRAYARLGRDAWRRAA